MTPNLKGIHDYFEITKDLKFNKKSLNRDIKRYGLYDIKNWPNYISENLFKMFNFKYFKISFTKGLATKEIILEYVKYLKGLQDNGEVLIMN